MSAVILRASPRESLSAVAESLAELRGVPVLDTMREARSGWGIVAESIPGQEAARLVESLTRRGVPAMAVPQDALPPLPPAVPTDRIEYDDRGFRCRLESGLTPEIPWTALAWGAAAVIKTTVVTVETRQEGPSAAEKWVKRGIFMTTGIPLPGGKTKTVKDRKEETALVAVFDLALTRPAGRFRLDAGDLDFSVLGNRRGYDSFGNFRLLAGDLAAHIADDHGNHGLRVLKSNAPLADMGYESIQDFEREERWLQARLRAS